eukprot:761900-Hanusia_phi.AAC.2
MSCTSAVKIVAQRLRSVSNLVADLATCAMIQNHVDHTVMPSAPGTEVRAASPPDDTKLLALFDRPLQLLLLGNVVPSPWQVPLRIGAGRGRRVPDDVEASSSEGRDVLVKKFVQLGSDRSGRASLRYLSLTSLLVDSNSQSNPCSITAEAGSGKSSVFREPGRNNQESQDGSRSF